MKWEGMLGDQRAEYETQMERWKMKRSSGYGFNYSALLNMHGSILTAASIVSGISDSAWVVERTNWPETADQQEYWEDEADWRYSYCDREGNARIRRKDIFRRIK